MVLHRDGHLRKVSIQKKSVKICDLFVGAKAHWEQTLHDTPKIMGLLAVLHSDNFGLVSSDGTVASFRVCRHV